MEKYLRCKRDICRIIWKSAKSGKLALAHKLWEMVKPDTTDKLYVEMSAMLLNIGGVLSTDKFYLEGYSLGDQECRYIANQIRGIAQETIPPIGENKLPLLVVITKILMGNSHQPPPLHSDDGIWSILILISLAAIFENGDQIREMKNVILEMINTESGPAMYFLQLLITRYGNLHIMEIIQNIVIGCQHTLSNEILLLDAVNAGNYYTIPALLDIYQKNVDCLTFKTFVEQAINLARDHSDLRMIKILQKQ